MEKKPKLLDKKRLIISCNSPLNFKILEQSLKTIKEYESVTENEMPKFLARIFMYEPKLVVIAHETLKENMEFARHIRLNSTFSDLPIICLSNPPKKDSAMTRKKITLLNINYFMIPVNNMELTKVINQSLES